MYGGDSMINHNFTNKEVKEPQKKAPSAATKPAGKPPFTEQDFEDLTTPALREVVFGDFTTTYMITGKAYGKNRAVGLKIIHDMEADSFANAVALKKYKTNAGARLHSTIFNLYMELKTLGYSVKNYRKGQSETYREVRKDNQLNQTIEYASAEKTDELSGIEAKNLGYYAVAWFDEPVISEDTPDKIPSPEQWDKFIDIFIDSVGRSNSNRERVLRLKNPTKPADVPATRFFYTMNPWDKHPVILEADKLAPESDFLAFVKQDVIENHTKLYKFPSLSKQILRGTKFGNPIIYNTERLLRAFGVTTASEFTQEVQDQINWADPIFIKYNITPRSVLKHMAQNDGAPIYVKAEKAIKENNKTDLARLLGLSFEGESGYTKTYNLTMLKTADTDKILSAPMTKTVMATAWDIDSRAEKGKYVFTPVYLVKGNNLKTPGSIETIDGKPYREVKNIVVGKQIEISAGAGLGDRGQNKPKYVSKIIEIMEENKKKAKSMGVNCSNRPVCAFDDNAKSFVGSVSDVLGQEFSVRTATFKNTKHWQIAKRERWLQSAIDSGMLIIDESNKGLIKNLKDSYIKQGGSQRYEQGKPEDYDRINSMEYGLYFFRRELVPNIQPGTPEHYHKEVHSE